MEKPIANTLLLCLSLTLLSCHLDMLSQSLGQSPLKKQEANALGVAEQNKVSSPSELEFKRLKEAQRVDDLSVADREWVEKKVAGLIAKLADDNYTIRQKASAELQQIGMLAFEQLGQAAIDPDPQIASTANYILQSIRQDWTWDSDPIEVREILANYGSSTTVDRASDIDRLAKLDFLTSVAPLCRLCRYETNENLSRHAALRLLNASTQGDGSVGEDSLPPLAAVGNLPRARSTFGHGDPESRIAIAKSIRQVIGVSGRQGCVWLLQLAYSMETEEFPAKRWIEATESVHRELSNQSKPNRGGDDMYTRSLVRSNATSLDRWVCRQLLVRENRREALAVATKMQELIPATSTDLGFACDWALSIGLPEWIDQLSDLHRNEFQLYAKLAYAQAESYRVRFDDSRANEAARKAFERGVFQGRQIIPPSIERRTVAKTLAERGLYDWAEREYAEAIRNADPLNPASLSIFEEFSNLLADGQQYQAVANVWEPLVRRLQNEPLFRQQFEASYQDYFDGRIADVFIERFYFHQAKASVQRGDKEEALEQFAAGVAVYNLNSDAFIEMYRLTSDSTIRTKIQEDAKPLIENLRLRASDERVRNEGNIQQFATHRYDQSQARNELAWLASNIGGDLDEALSNAQGACGYSPKNSAYVDTLARVHFARGELTQAIEIQKRAISFEPQDRQMRRVLAEYEEALKKSLLDKRQ